MLAIALCHNVTPVVETAHAPDTNESDDEQVVFVSERLESSTVTYQSSSPDEVSLTSII